MSFSFVDILHIFERCQSDPQCSRTDYSVIKQFWFAFLKMHKQRELGTSPSMMEGLSNDKVLSVSEMWKWSFLWRTWQLLYSILPDQYISVCGTGCYFLYKTEVVSRSVCKSDWLYCVLLTLEETCRVRSWFKHAHVSRDILCICIVRGIWTGKGEILLKLTSSFWQGRGLDGHFCLQLFCLNIWIRHALVVKYDIIKNNISRSGRRDFLFQRHLKRTSGRDMFGSWFSSLFKSYGIQLIWAFQLCIFEMFGWMI